MSHYNSQNHLHSPTHPQHTRTQIGPGEYTPAESTLTVIQVDESEEQFNTVLLTVSITFTRNHGVMNLESAKGLIESWPSIASVCKVLL